MAEDEKAEGVSLRPLLILSDRRRPSCGRTGSGGLEGADISRLRPLHQSVRRYGPEPLSEFTSAGLMGRVPLVGLACCGLSIAGMLALCAGWREAGPEVPCANELAEGSG